MNLWPYPALDGMVEGIQWRTDVIRARAAEQRIRLTDIPRRILNQSYRLSPLQYERARAILRRYGPGPIYLPEWSEAARVTVSSGQLVIPVDTTAASYQVGGFAALVSDGAGEVLEVTDVDPTAITVAAGPVSDFTEARIAPAFEAFAPSGMEASHDPNKRPLAAVEWLIYSGQDIADDGGRTYYRGDPVLNQCARVGFGVLDEQIVRVVDAVDNGIATPFFSDVMTEAVQTLGAAFMPTRGAEVYELRQWFHFLKGAQKAFWLPAWNYGVQIQADIGLGDPTITIASIGFAGAYGSGDLFLKLNDGSFYALQVASSVDDGITETLTLSSPAPAVDLANLKLSCLLFRVRLAADRVEFAHMAGYGARVVVPCIEVPI